jgi:hypothetical protein
MSPKPNRSGGYETTDAVVENGGAGFVIPPDWKVVTIPGEDEVCAPTAFSPVIF